MAVKDKDGGEEERSLKGKHSYFCSGSGRLCEKLDRERTKEAERNDPYEIGMIEMDVEIRRDALGR